MALHLPKRMTRAGTMYPVVITNLAQLKEFENDPAFPCTEHWMFDKGGPAGLTGLKGGGLLTDAGAAKTWNPYTVTIPGTLGARLNTSYGDRTTWSACIVAKVPATGSGGGVGTPLVSTREGTTTGGVNFAIQGGTSLDMSSRAIISGASSQQGANPANFVVTEFRFFAFVIDHTGANRLRRMSTGGVHFDYTDSAAFTVAPANKIGLGPTANDSNTPAAIEFCEFILFNDIALTTAQIDEIRGRSQARIARHSAGTITVV